ncbi:MAG: apolipoprotein N-acyltransferase, partial [Myxococcota bacterium]
MRARELLLAITAGLLSAAAFPPLSLHLLAWIGWVPLLLVIRGRAPRPAFALGLLAGLVANLGTFHWIVVVVHSYGHAPLAFALLSLLLLSAYLALYPAIWAGGVAAAARRGAGAAVWLGAPIWVGLELLRAHALSGFPWALQGYSQTPFTPVIQIAEWTGVYGVSVLVVLVTLGVAALLWRREERRAARPAILRLLGIGVLVAALAGWGAWRLEDIRARMQDRAPLPVALVQGNIPQDVKWSPAFVASSLARYLALTRDASESAPAFIVWPEAAVTFFFQDEEELA